MAGEGGTGEGDPQGGGTDPGTQGGGENPTGGTENTGGGEQQPTWKDGQPYDAEKAQALIDKLRDSEKAQMRRIEELEKAQKERERAEMSELERIKAENEELQQERDALRRQTEEQALRSSFTAKAIEKGMDPAAVTDAFYAAQRDGLIEVKDGEAVGILDAVESFRSSKPFYFGSSNAGGQGAGAGAPVGGGGTGGAAGGSGGPALTAEEAAAAAMMGMSHAEYAEFAKSAVVTPPPQQT